MLASQYEVVAEVAGGGDDKPAGQVTVTEVLFGKDGPAVGQQIEVGNLHECRGFTGPGSYLLPLAKVGNGYIVAVPPLDPGVGTRFPPVVYPATASVRKQLSEIRSAGR